MLAPRTKQPVFCSRTAFLPVSLRSLYLAILVAAIGSVSATCAVADTIAVDEQGHIVINGNLGPIGVLAPDPDSNTQVLTYSLPFLGNPGEVVLTDANSSVSDIIRFPGNGTLEYYSVIKEQTLSAAAPAGTTNIKVSSTAGYSVGDQIIVDPLGANPEKETITAVGTSGATGTGLTLATPLAFAHAAFSDVTEPNLQLADLFFTPFLPGGATVSLTEGASVTFWSPGTSGIGGGQTSPQYEFGAALIPVPGALPLFAGGLAALGLLTWHRKRKALAA